MSDKPQSTFEKPTPKASAAKGPKLVKMRRESDGKLAEVHPDEVENFRRGDFKEV